MMCVYCWYSPLSLECSTRALSDIILSKKHQEKIILYQ